MVTDQTPAQIAQARANEDGAIVVVTVAYPEGTSLDDWVAAGMAGSDTIDAAAWPQLRGAT